MDSIYYQIYYKTLVCSSIYGNSNTILILGYCFLVFLIGSKMSLLSKSLEKS